MDSGSNAPSVERKSAILGTDIWKWGLPYDGPRTGEHEYINRRARRKMRQRIKMEAEYEKEE